MFFITQDRKLIIFHGAFLFCQKRNCLGGVQVIRVIIQCQTGVILPLHSTLKSSILPRIVLKQDQMNLDL